MMIWRLLASHLGHAFPSRPWIILCQRLGTKILVGTFNHHDQ